MNGESYIVRIYRREIRADGQRANDRVRLVGRVEPVDGSAPRTFHDLHELWAALCNTRPDPFETGTNNDRR